MKRIAVLIPCYNEAQTIGQVISEYRQALPEADIYVYDNNSTDQTSAIARKAGAIVRKEQRQGKGHVVRAMFRDIDADCYLMTDGDNTYPPGCAREMVDMILLGHNDMVIGDRLSSTYFSENKRRFHNGGNVLVRTLINHLFSGDITDIMTGSRAFSPLFVKTFPSGSSGFEIETEMTIHALDKMMRVASLPVEYRDRPDGSHSKLNTVSDGFRIIGMMIRLLKNFRPLLFFGTIAALFGAAAGILIIPVLVEYFQTGLVPKFPSLIMAVAMGIACLLSLSSGMVLGNIASAERRIFQWHVSTIRILLRQTEGDSGHDAQTTHDSLEIAN